MNCSGDEFVSLYCNVVACGKLFLTDRAYITSCSRRFDINKQFRYHMRRVRNQVFHVQIAMSSLQFRLVCRKGYLFYKPRSRNRMEISRCTEDLADRWFWPVFRRPPFSMLLIEPYRSGITRPVSSSYIWSSKLRR